MPYRTFYGSDHKLLPVLSETGKYENKNTKEYLWSLVETIREYLRYVQRSPSVHMDFFPPGIDGLRAEMDDELDEKMQESEEGRHGLENGVGTGARGQLVD